MPSMNISRVAALSAVIIIFALQPLSAVQARPSPISYTYAEIAYQETEFEIPGGDVDADGVKLEGSIELGKYFHALARLETNQFDSVNTGFGVVNFPDVDEFGIGIGVHTPLTPGEPNRLYSDRFSGFLQLEFLNADPDTGSDVDGFAITSGIRIINSTAFEFIGEFGYEEFDGADGELQLGARLLYEFVPNLKAQVGVETNDENTQWFIGARYSFRGVGLFQ